LPVADSIRSQVDFLENVYRSFSENLKVKFSSHFKLLIRLSLFN
jgi:hypothetical protein